MAVQMFLEGPGMERRAVRFLAINKTEIVTRYRGATIVIDAQRLVDDEGQIATQVDVEGLRFQFQQSAIIGSLLVA